jgi:hypothetical protein
MGPEALAGTPSAHPRSVRQGWAAVPARQYPAVQSFQHARTDKAIRRGSFKRQASSACIVDNYTTHGQPKVKAWLATHPRISAMIRWT